MNKIFGVLYVLVFCMCLVSPAQASSCYSRTEAEAEQGIRIHSELMIIGLNCQHMGKREGMNLYQQYRQFTADHAGVFGGYEETLMAYYKRNGDPKPEASLNLLRTNFANKISNDVARVRPDVFCSRYAPRVTKAATMKDSDIRKWAAIFHPDFPVSRPMCASAP